MTPSFDSDFPSLPHALLEYDQGLKHPFAPSSLRWHTSCVFEYIDDDTSKTTHPHILAIVINGVEGNNVLLLRGELITILQLMVNRMEEKGHENDAIVPVSISYTYI